MSRYNETYPAGGTPDNVADRWMLLIVTTIFYARARFMVSLSSSP